MNLESNLAKMGDEGWGMKEQDKSTIMSTITKILSTRLLIHSCALIPTLLDHYGELSLIDPWRRSSSQYLSLPSKE